MAITLEIATVDKSSVVDWTSIKKIDEINENVDRLRFRIKKYGTQTYSPNLNDDVKLKRDGTTIFGGVIVRMRETVKGKNLLVYDIEAKDYSQYLNRQLVSERYENQSANAIISDLITTYTSGFTTNNVVSSLIIDSIAFNRIRVGDCIQKLADLIGYSWYVDQDKDIHFFAKNQDSAPFNLTDTSGNYIYRSLQFVDDLSQIRNKILVIGGEAEGSSRTEVYLGDTTNGVDTFALANKFASKPTVEVASSAQTVGLEYIDDDASYDVMWDFNQKYIRFTSGNVPADDAVIEVTGIPLFPIVVNVPSDASINEFGTYEFVIQDKTIRSQTQAIDRAIAELNAYGSEIVEGEFETYTDGLRSGQVMNIQSTIRGRDEDVLIQKVEMKPRSPNGEPVYAVKFATLRTIGIIDILQKLLRQEELTENENEILLNFYQFSDSFTFTDSTPTVTTSEGPYYYATATGGKTEAKWSYSTWGTS